MTAQGAAWCLVVLSLALTAAGAPLGGLLLAVLALGLFLRALPTKEQRAARARNQAHPWRDR